MSRIILRGGVELENPLELVLELLEAYSSNEAYDCSGPASFDEGDLRLANRGVARISATEIATILERRGEIERALRKIRPDASLADATSSIPWLPLTRLFDAFADIRGVGFSKTTKALHGKRTALIPMLDSVVEAYLTRDPRRARLGRSGSAPPRSFAASSETWIATERRFARSRESWRAAPTRSPRCESSIAAPARRPKGGPRRQEGPTLTANARREVAELASALRGPRELREYMRLRSGMRYRAAASHRKEWRLAYRGLRLDR